MVSIPELQDEGIALHGAGYVVILDPEHFAHQLEELEQAIEAEGFSLVRVDAVSDLDSLGQGGRWVVFLATGSQSSVVEQLPVKSGKFVTIAVAEDAQRSLCLELIQKGTIDDCIVGRASARGIAFACRIAVARAQRRLELQEGLDEARRGLERRSGFLAKMTHEVRTPLTAILGFAEQMATDSDMTIERHRDFAKVIHRSSRHLLAVVNDVLDLSALEAGKVALEFTDCPLLALVRELEELFSNRAAEKNLKFSSVIEYPIPASIRSDALRLRQILFNLLSNSFKFTDQGQVKLRIFFNFDRSQMQFEISDTGKGISREKQRELFSPYSQLSTGGSDSQIGTGLGLYLSRELAQRLGGDILVQSEEDRGSTFILSLKVASVCQEELIYQQPGERHFSSQEKQSHHTSPRKERLSGKVLLAEDCQESRQILSYLLSSVGLEVEAVEDGRLALEKILANSFDLVLMDLNMPVLDGYMAVREMREQGMKMPIIALTADVLDGTMKRCIEAGFSGYISKPFERDIFIASVRTALDKTASQGELSIVFEGEVLRSDYLFDPRFADVIMRYIEQLPGNVDEISSFFSRGELQNLRDTAHRLSGASAVCGFADISSLFRQIEQAVDKGQVTVVERILPELHQSSKRLYSNRGRLEELFTERIQERS